MSARSKASRKRAARRLSQPFVRSYHTFSQQEQYSGSESAHSFRSDSAVLKSSRARSISQISTDSSSSSSEKSPSNTSRLTLDPILNRIDPVNKRSSSDSSGPIGNSSAHIVNNASVDSPTCSTDEADNIRPMGGGLPLIHHPAYQCQEIPQESTLTPLFNKKCICSSLWKALLCAVLLTSTILSCLHTKVVQLDKVSSYIFILEANQTREKDFTIQENYSDFTILLEAIDGPKGKGNKTLVHVEVTGQHYCVSTNITQKNINKWTHHPHFALVRCEKNMNVNSAEAIPVKFTNKINQTLGLAIYVNTEKLQTAYFVAVFVVLLLLHLSLLLEVMKPMVVVLVAASTANILYTLCEVQDRVGELTDTVGIVPGGIADQLFLVAGMMVMVNSLIQCGFYSSLTYRISAMARYRWKRGVFIILLLATLFSMLFGRMATVQLLIPLVICYAEAYNLSSGKLICIFLVFINTGNLLLPVGNDMLTQLFQNYNETAKYQKTDSIGSLAVVVVVVMLICGIVNLAFTSVWFRFLWLRKLPSTNAEMNMRDFRKAQMLVNWKERMPGLTKAGIACRQLADGEEKSLNRALFNTADGQVQAYNLNCSDQAWIQNYHRMIISAYYFMSDWQSVCYCGGITALTLVAFPAVSWISQVTITPGIVSAIAAVWLIIVIDNEEKTVKSLDWSTLLFLALYRYTIRTLMSGTILDGIASIYEQLLQCDNSHYGLQTVIIWFSGLFCSLVGMGNFSPDLPRVFSELLPGSGQDNTTIIYCLICQVVGATLSGNVLLYSSLSNVVAKNFAAEHGIKVLPWKFLRFGLPVAVFTTALSTAVVLIGYTISSNY